MCTGETWFGEGAFCWNVGLCLVSIAVSSGCGGESLLDTRFTRAARAVEIVKLSVVCDRQGLMQSVFGCFLCSLSRGLIRGLGSPPLPCKCVLLVTTSSDLGQVMAGPHKEVMDWGVVMQSGASACFFFCLSSFLWF